MRNLHLTPLRWLVFALTALSVLAGVFAWRVLRKSSQKKYTRERFAFAGLTVLSTLGGAVISSAFAETTPLEVVLTVIAALRGKDRKVESAPGLAYVVSFGVLLVVYKVVTTIFREWGGPVSRDERKDQPPSILRQGLSEIPIIFGNSPKREIEPLDARARHERLIAPSNSLAWEVQAIELIGLRTRDYDFDKDSSWHDLKRCWVGTNTRTGELVLVRCSEASLTEDQQVEFVAYARQLRDRASAPGLTLISAVRSGKREAQLSVDGESIREQTEATLLDGLVDFSSYFFAIRKRVERDVLPDSSYAIKDTYAASTVRDGNGNDEDVEVFLDEWLRERSRRHVALLGEYGQGKSTCALMFVYRLICQSERDRVPILIELRGQSLRNMTPEQLIASWAVRYRIDPLAMMKLNAAGHLILIFEGFDEIDLFGDAELRLSHFRTLWRFAYPESKLLITGRPNFFLDEDELKLALNIQEGTGGNAYCRAVRLNPFSLEQIQLALRVAKPNVRNEIATMARTNDGFREIASRASLLYLIMILWEREEFSSDRNSITSAFVMERFIHHSYLRQTAKQDGENTSRFMVLAVEERSFFMEGIAAYMVDRMLPNQIMRSEVEVVVKQLYDVYPEPASQTVGASAPEERSLLHARLKDVEHAFDSINNDIRACGLLVDDPSKFASFKFAHKSFLEYLGAKIASDRLLKDAARDAKVAALVVVSPRLIGSLMQYRPSLAFLAEILLEKTQTEGRRALPFVRGSDDERAARQLLRKIVFRGSRTERILAEFIMLNLKVYDNPPMSWIERMTLAQTAVLERNQAVLVGAGIVAIMGCAGILYFLSRELFALVKQLALTGVAVTFVVLTSVGAIASALRLRNHGWPERSDLVIWASCCASVGIGEKTINRILGVRKLPPMFAAMPPELLLRLFLDGADPFNSRYLPSDDGVRGGSFARIARMRALAAEINGGMSPAPNRGVVHDARDGGARPGKSSHE